MTLSKIKESFLEALINKKEKYIALNEIVIHSGAIAQLIDFDLFIDSEFVYRQKADGLIISSPSGSTAYSLIRGWSYNFIQTSRSLFIVPMFPHSLNTSPLIIDEESKIKIED